MPRNANQSKSSNYSMDFDGGSQRISLNTSTISFSDSFSISMWINPSSLSGYQMLFSGSGYSGGTAIGHYIYDDTVRTYVSVSGSATQIFQSSALLNIGSWTHIIIQREKGTKWEMWIDGVLEETNTSARLTDDLTSANSTIAKHYNSTSYNFDGKITEVSIFDYALSPSQVTTLWGGGTSVSNPMALPSPPIAYYPLGTSAYNGEYLAENNAIGDYVFDFGTFTSNDRIVINDTFDTIITGTNFTISSWINLDSVLSNQIKFIFTNESLQLTITDKITTYLRGASGYFLNPFNSNTTLTTGKWYNVVFVKSGSDYTYYLNGSADGTVNNSTSVVNSSQTTSIIGMYYSGSYGFDGKMSNVQIFDSALSSTEIETLYNYGSPIQTLANIPQNSNLKAWYKLDASEVYNSTTTEWSIDNNQNPSAYPSSLEFDSASSDAITLGNTIGNGFTQITCSIWANISTSGLTQSTYRNFLVKFPGGTNYATPFELRSSNGNRVDTYNNKLFFRVNTNTGSYGYTDTGFEFTEANKWHHLVGTYDGSNVKLFVDGVEYYSISASGTLNSNTNNATIGKFGSTGDFNGKLSNASIWNAALTSTQVTELYNNGTPSNLSSHSATSNLVSWWKLNNTTTGIEDAKGSNNGTNNGATEYAGFVNKLVGDSSGMSQANLVQSDLQTVAPYSKYALDFDGADDYIDCGNDSSLQITSDLSISAWFKIDNSSPNSYFNIITKWISGNAAWSSYVAKSTGILSFWISTNGSTQIQINSNTNVNDGNWHHFTGINDGTNIKLYIDGNLENTGTGGTIYNSTQNVLIGKTNQNSFLFSGSISNASIWNTALTSTQVSEIYNQGLPSNLNSHSAYSNLVSWWQLGENSSFDGNDWIVADEKGTNNGTSTGMPVGALVNGVGTTANGVSSGMSEGNLVGDAPYSTANAISTNMVVTSRVTGSGNTP